MIEGLEDDKSDTLVKSLRGNANTGFRNNHNMPVIASECRPDIEKVLEIRMLMERCSIPKARSRNEELQAVPACT